MARGQSTGIATSLRLEGRPGLRAGRGSSEGSPSYYTIVTVPQSIDWKCRRRCNCKSHVQNAEFRVESISTSGSQQSSTSAPIRSGRVESSRAVRLDRSRAWGGRKDTSASAALASFRSRVVVRVMTAREGAITACTVMPAPREGARMASCSHGSEVFRHAEGVRGPPTSQEGVQRELGRAHSCRCVRRGSSHSPASDQVGWIRPRSTVVSASVCASVFVASWAACRQ